MATTKSMQCRYVVKEGGELNGEPQKGIVTSMDTQFITAEPFDRKPDHERPLSGPNHLWFPLKPGTSLEKAQEIADFLNENLADVAITAFGDTEDLARDVMQSERLQQVDTERLAHVISSLKERLAANDVPGATEALNGVESVAEHINEGWLKALALSRSSLDKVGKHEGGIA
jgi:hypothetical protein